MQIAFIGLGKLGLPCATTMFRHGHHVVGYDPIDIKADFAIAKDIAQAVSGRDLVFVAVPTPHQQGYDGSSPTSHLEPRDFDYAILKSVITECDRNMTKDQALVIISTVLPGTMRRDISPLVNNTNLVYNPYLIAMGTVEQDLVDPEMIMIGTKGGEINSLAKNLQKFYEDLCGKDVRTEFGNWEEVEAMKIFYNTFISTKLSLVNMIQDVAHKLGHMDVDRVATALANSTRRIISNRYMKAGMGDGGACHPRDNIALRWLALELDLGYDLFGAVMIAREKQAENMALEILKHGKKVFFSSNSYKSGTDLVDGSYSLLVQHYVQKHQGQIASQQDDSVKVIVRVHESDSFVDNGRCIVFDTWRSYPVADNVVYYGK